MKAGHSLAGTIAVLTSLVLVISSCSLTSTDGTPTAASSSGTVAAQPVPTIVVLDASESMTTADAPGPRIDAARAAVRSLADSVPTGTDLGVVTFGSTMPAKKTSQAKACTDVVTTVPLGPVDKTPLSTALDKIVAQGFTPIGSALNSAAEQLPTTGKASIVLVSDGESTCNPDPCETAKAIHSARPDVTISAVGFRTDHPSLKCIADAGGGLFVTADNAAQLSARLAAAQNSDGASTKLSTTSRGGIAIGQSIDDIRAANPTFPSQGQRSGDRTIYVWQDCTYGFDSHGKLVEIAPGDPPGSKGVTIDGVGAGSPGARAVELYGKAVEDKNGVAIFPADAKAKTGYKIGYSGGESVEKATVTTVILCGCLPSQDSGGPEVVTVIGADRSGTPINGWSVDASVPDLRLSSSAMEYCQPGLGAVTSDVYFCGTTADSAVVCWNKASASQLLCAYSPWVKQLRVFNYSTPPKLSVSRRPDPMPWAIELTDGTRCVLKFGGAWEPAPDGYSEVYGCGGSPTKYLVRKSGSTGGGPDTFFDKSGTTWTVLFSGTRDSGIQPTPKPVKRIYYSAAEQ